MRLFLVSTVAVFACLTARAQDAPTRVTYGAGGRVVAVTGIGEERDSEGCAKDRVAGTVVKVEADGDYLDLTLRIPAGPVSVNIETEGMNPADRQAMIATLLSRGNSVSVQVNECGMALIMYATSIRVLPLGSPGYPPAPKIISGGSTFRELRRFVGKYENSAALRNTALRHALGHIGLTDYRKLDYYTGVAGPVALEGDDVLIAGCAPHQ
jgi:hypothetical protein